MENILLRQERDALRARVAELEARLNEFHVFGSDGCKNCETGSITIYSRKNWCIDCLTLDGKRTKQCEPTIEAKAAQGGVMDKDKTFIKQVERTAKRDAYETAAMYIEQFGLDYGLRTIKEKAASHSHFLDSLPLAYDYATQSLSAKGDAVDGRAVAAAMGNLSGNILSATDANKKKATNER
jgi:hypothetical protein